MREGVDDPLAERGFQNFSMDGFRRFLWKLFIFHDTPEQPVRKVWN